MRAPLSLFAVIAATPALAQGIVPKDGDWTTTTEAVTFADSCSGQIKPMLEPMANAMRNEETIKVDWGGTFDPSKIDPDNQAGVNWTQTDANTWQGAMTNPATGEGIVASIRVVAISPERIEGAIQLDFERLFAGDPNMASVAEMAKGCSVSIDSASVFSG